MHHSAQPMSCSPGGDIARELTDIRVDFFSVSKSRLDVASSNT